VNENRLPDYLDHMQQAAADACSFIDGLGRDDLEEDKRTQQAVIMSLIIIGEAATKMMERCAEFAEQHADVQSKNLHRLFSKSRATGRI